MDICDSPSLVAVKNDFSDEHPDSDGKASDRRHDAPTVLGAGFTAAPLRILLARRRHVLAHPVLHVVDLVLERLAGRGDEHLQRVDLLGSRRLGLATRRRVGLVLLSDCFLGGLQRRGQGHVSLRELILDAAEFLFVDLR